MAKTTLTNYFENISNKSASQCVKLAQTLGRSMRLNAFKVAMLCEHATDKNTKGAVSQNEFSNLAEISKGTLSEIMKAYRIIKEQGDDTMTLFLDGSVEFHYVDIARYFGKVELSVVEICNKSRKELAELVSGSSDEQGKSGNSKGGNSKSGNSKGGNEDKILVTDQHGNKYMIPASVLAEYAI